MFCFILLLLFFGWTTGAVRPSEARAVRPAGGNGYADDGGPIRRQRREGKRNGEWLICLGFGHVK